jgi:hypothetical protein
LKSVCQISPKLRAPLRAQNDPLSGEAVIFSRCGDAEMTI